VDPFGAGLAALAGALMTAALVFSYHYFEDVGYLFYTLMLVFLGALVGFAITGDLFNLFVFFELMSVSAYALTGYKVEQPAVLLAGVMSDLGFHAVARIYWDVFSGPTAGHADAVRGLLVGVGLLTALLGAAMCLLEADLKRLLAFLTISHGGIFLVGVGLLRAGALAGS